MNRVHAALAASLLIGLTPGVRAADAPVPPVRSTVDERGVDLLSGKLIFSTADVSIGPADARGLSFARQWIERAWRPTLIPVLSGSSSNPVVSFNGSSASFTSTGPGWEPDARDGSTLNYSAGVYIYTARDGMTIRFQVDGNQFVGQEVGLAAPALVTFPNGVQWRFSYQNDLYAVQGEPDPECVKNCTQPITRYYWKRLSSVTTSAGYQLKFSYASNTLTNEEDLGTWGQLSRVTGINNAVEACDPGAVSCALSQPWPHADYAYQPSASTSTMTDPAGQVWTYVYSPHNFLTGIKRPNAPAPTTSYGYTLTGSIERLTSVTRGGSS